MRGRNRDLAILWCERSLNLPYIRHFGGNREIKFKVPNSVNLAMSNIQQNCKLIFFRKLFNQKHIMKQYI
jgi:hypothetical protein